MERAMERQWQRSFAAGAAALAVGVGGQLAFGAPSPGLATCALSQEPAFVERLVERLAPRPSAPLLVGRVVLSLVLRACS